MITKVDGRSVISSAELSSAIGNKKPGDKIALEYVRNGKVSNATATLRRELGQIGDEVAAATGAASLGATLKPVDNATARSAGISSGLQVSNLKDGVLRRSGIANGFIIMSANNQTIKTQQDLDKVITEATRRGSVVLVKGVYPDGDGYMYQYRLDLRGRDTE